MTSRELAALTRRASKLTPRPVLLKSGTWRCQSSWNGRRISATGDTPEEAWSALMAQKTGTNKKSGPNISVGTAVDNYIESKDAVLSPSTIAVYRRCRANYFPELMDTAVSRLTQEDVQRAVNSLAKKVSPKTVRNAWGLLSAALAVHDVSFHITLPPKQRQEMEIPTDAEVKGLISAAEGTALELPVLLAAEMGLRTSEIRALTWDCIADGRIHIHQAIVDGDNGPELKGTKSYSGDRWIALTPHVADCLSRWRESGRPAIPNQSHFYQYQIPEGYRMEDFVCPETRSSIYGRFQRLCDAAGVPRYRFHALRHYHASVLLALGYPDKYAMERMGHGTNYTLKQIYQHTMSDTAAALDRQVEDYFSR